MDRQQEMMFQMAHHPEGCPS